MIYTYSYTEPIGDGVDIYIVDSGVYTEHSEFERRAIFGWAAEGLDRTDDNGHGTYVAGIAAGRVFGVAKKANIIAVKVLDHERLGRKDDIIDGLSWVSTNVRSTGRPSIACVCINGPHMEAVDDAANALIKSGVTLVVSAGNTSEDARNTSPASAIHAIVVGASNISNNKRWNSNFGPAVDVFAPGEDIRAAWVDGPRSTNQLNGTSAATAHVAGIAANFLSIDPRMTPSAIGTKIWLLQTEDAISDVPPGTTTDFVFNGGSQ